MLSLGFIKPLLVHFEHWLLLCWGGEPQLASPGYSKVLTSMFEMGTNKALASVNCEYGSPKNPYG